MIVLAVLVAIAAFLAAAMTGAWVIARRTGRSGWIDTIWSYSVGVTGMAAALSSVPVGPWPSSRQLLVAALVIGFGNGLGSGAMLTLGSDLAPKESAGEFLGMWRLIGDTGQTGAPIVVGGVAQLVGLSPATFVIAAMGVAAALVFGMFVPETKDLSPRPVQAKA